MLQNTVRSVEIVKAQIAALNAELVALKAAEKANKPVVTVSPQLKERVLLAIKTDPKTTNGKYYTTFAAFIIHNAIKKYSTSDQVKDATWKAAAKGYGIEIK
jgi:hypothetical protein